MICLDANVLIEIIVDRKNAAACRTYINSAQGELATTMLSVDLVMYYTERHKLNTEPVEQFLRQFIWLPLIETDADWAFRQGVANDFEDALQIACAKREKCGRFATLDASLAKRYADTLAVDLL